MLYAEHTDPDVTGGVLKTVRDAESLVAERCELQPDRDWVGTLADRLDVVWNDLFAPRHLAEDDLLNLIALVR